MLLSTSESFYRERKKKLKKHRRKWLTCISRNLLKSWFKRSSSHSMANRTVKDAKTVKGTNPQYLIEKITRTRWGLGRVEGKVTRARWGLGRVEGKVTRWGLGRVETGKITRARLWRVRSPWWMVRSKRIACCQRPMHAEQILKASYANLLIHWRYNIISCLVGQVFIFPNHKHIFTNLSARAIGSANWHVCVNRGLLCYDFYNDLFSGYMSAGSGRRSALLLQLSYW